MGSLRQFLLQLLRQVVGGGPETAEDHRPEALRQQSLELFEQLLELGIVGLAAQAIGAPDQILQQPGISRVRQIGPRGGFFCAELLFRTVEHGERGHGFEVIGQLVIAGGCGWISAALEIEQLGAQGGRGGSGAAAHTAQQRQSGPPAHPLAQLALANAPLHEFTGIGQHVIEQTPPVATEGVGGLAGFTIGEVGTLGAPFLFEIEPAALHEIVAQFIAQVLAALALGHFAEALEFRIEQPEQVVERLLVAAVRCGGEQHQVALGISGQAPKQLIALLTPATLARSAGVGLIDDHELAAAAQEALAVAVALDPIQAHHRERNHVKDRLAGRQSPLQLLGGAGPHHLGRQVELADHVALPLLTQVRRADHRDLADLAPIQQFAGDQQRLHRLAEAHLVGDQHPTHLLLERHQQRHQLVRPRLQRHVAEAAERSRTGA